MILNVDRKEFRPCMNALARVAPKTSTIEALCGVRLEADRGRQTLTLTATDLTIGLQYELAAEVEETGCAVIDAALLSDALRLATKDSIRIETKKTQFYVDTGCKYHLSCLPTEEFPVPEFMTPDGSITLEKIPDLAARVCHIAAPKVRDDNCHAVKLTFSEAGVSAVSCDGGTRTIQVMWPGENTGTLDLLIPAKALALLSSLVGAEAVLYVGATEQCAMFYDGMMTFSVRLLKGKYLDTDLVFDAVQPVYFAEVDNAALCQSLELASAPYDADRFQLKLEADHLEVGCSSAQAQCVNSVPIMKGNGPAAVPFYYGKTLPSSIKPLGDTLVLFFSDNGQLIVGDGHTKLFQNSMRAPSLLQVEKKPTAKKEAAAKKEPAKKRTKKAKTPKKEAA